MWFRFYLDVSLILQHSKTEPHLYDETLSYIQNCLGRDDVILSEKTRLKR